MRWVALLCTTVGTGTACFGNNGFTSQQGTLASGSVAPIAFDPGIVVLHRLNRAEYNNTVRDLLNTRLHPADAFVADGVAGGFDNIAAALVVDLALPAQYETAATTLAQQAVDPNGAGFALIAACDAALGKQVADTCLRADLAAFARRAWRRPLQDGEIEALVATAQTGDTASERLQLGIIAALMSPYFIYRVEIDPDPISTSVHRLNDYELAARLSYFLWSSTPDDALLATADAGHLQDPNVFAAQVSRMLSDAKTQAFIDNFGGQWLGQRTAALAHPDSTTFPSFSADVKTAMLSETNLFLHDVLLGAAPMTDLLGARYTYVNDTLAKFYDLAPPESTTPVKVALPADSKRTGLLTQGSVLLAGAHPTTNSPVLRGRFVLQQLLCTQIAAPPMTVSTSLTSTPGKTLRQELEQHVTNASCAACHRIMDPIGFAFEAFDGTGKGRALDNGLPVDTTGTLPGAGDFTDAPSMIALLQKDPRFVPCAIRNLTTYALGRVLDSNDEALLQNLRQQIAASNNSFAALIYSIVTSDAFTARRAQES